MPGDPLVTLYCCVRGPVYERYWHQLEQDARRFFEPSAVVEIVKLPSREGAWPRGSACRYGVMLENLELITGDFIFQIDADSRILNKVGPEILADGITVCTHPGFQEPGTGAWERREASTACVTEEMSAGKTYHPGAFVGGERRAFLDFATEVNERVEGDLRSGILAAWYEESQLNRYLIDHPPALILDRRYCWWEYWGNPNNEAIIMHLDKTAEEFAERNAA